MATVPVDKEDIVITFEMIGLSSTEQANLNSVNFQAVEFALYSDTHSQLIGKTLVSNTDQPWFSAYSAVLLNREANSAGEDKNVLQLYIKGDALDSWTAFDTSFLATK